QRRQRRAEHGPTPPSSDSTNAEERIFLEEEAPSPPVTRLRGLSLAESKTDGANGEVSDWKTDFEKKIIEHGNFSIENGKPIPNNPKNKISLEKMSVKLQPNPLLADA